jgi:hypothetical protein
LAFAFCLLPCSFALAQTAIYSVPIQYIQPYDVTQALQQMYCDTASFGMGTNLEEWQVASNLAWNDPNRDRTHPCWVDCHGQIHCSGSCSAAFPSGCAGASNPVNWYVNGTLIGTQPGGDFDAGSGITLSGLNDNTNHEVHITVTNNLSTGGCPTASGGTVPDSTFCAGPPYATSPVSPPVVQSALINEPACPLSHPLSLPVTAGDSIIVVATCGEGQSGRGCGTFDVPGNYPQISDSQDNTYSTLGTGPVFNMGYMGAWVATATASASGPLTVTVTNTNLSSYNAIGILEVTNLGTYEGSASNDTGAAPFTVMPVTTAYTTLNNGDFLLSVAGGFTNNPAVYLYQNSADWLNVAAPQEYNDGTYDIWYSMAASYQGAAGARSVTWSLYPSGNAVISDIGALIVAWKPGTYPPPGSGPPRFRLQVPTDVPSSILGLLNFQIMSQTFYALPACSGMTEGTIRPILDATVTAQGATISGGGGTSHVLAYCNGSNWVVASGSPGGSLTTFQDATNIFESSVGAAQSDVYQAGQDASSSSALGNITVRGADQSGTGGASSAGGGAYLRGGNNAATNAASEAGSLIFSPGMSTGATQGEQGILMIHQPFVKGATVTMWNLECFTAAMTVADCGANPGNIAGVAHYVGTNTVLIHAWDSESPVNASAAVAVTHTVCAGATAGEVTDSGGTAACTALQGIQVGIVIAVAGTWNLPDGSTFTLSTTLPLVQLTPPTLRTALQTNGSNNTSQLGVNFENSSTNSVGLTVTVSNPSTYNEKWEIGGSYTGSLATIAPITFDNDTQSSTPLTTAQLTGHTQVSYSVTVFEIDIFADTGTSQLNVSKVHAGTPTALMSAALPTGASGALACASVNATCVDGATTPSGTVSIVTTGSANVLAAGDLVEVTGATADGTATRVTAIVHMHH